MITISLALPRALVLTQAAALQVEVGWPAARHKAEALPLAVHGRCPWRVLGLPVGETLAKALHPEKNTRSTY